jgi:hypothetical protein
MSTHQPAKFICLFTLLLAIAGLSAKAQDFAWQAALPVIPDSSFYNIPLTPEIISKSHGTDLRDIRIYDQQHVVSYILSCEDSTMEQLPAPTIKTVTGAPAGYTILQLDFPGEYILRQLKFDVATPGYYFRIAYLTTDWRSGLATGARFTLATGRFNALLLPDPLKSKTCFVVIHDEDNAPLKIGTVSAWQYAWHLIAWLEKGKSYLLKTGNPQAKAPVYDLPYFAEKLPAKIPILQAGNITAIPAVINAQPTHATTKEPTIFKNKGWIWTGIISIILLISLLTIRLLKDMREKKQD